MPKTDNPHSIRLYSSLVKHVDAPTAQRIAHKIPLSKSADADKKFAWAQNICTDLEKEMDDETIKSIRMDCACGPDAGKINSLKKLYLSCSSMEAFAEKATSMKQGYEMNYEGESLYLVYPECYCSCVKRVDKLLSKTWCYCTLGYAKKMFESIFDRPVEVELLGSIKMGDKRCIIKITQ